jgi:hypothetical protein
MGTAQNQGELWGTRARDWVEANEPAWLPVYQAVLDHAGEHQTFGCLMLDAVPAARWLLRIGVGLWCPGLMHRRTS